MIKFPEVFRNFDQLRTIFPMKMYTFLESVGQGAADEPIKTVEIKAVEIFFSILLGRAQIFEPYAHCAL